MFLPNRLCYDMIHSPGAEIGVCEPYPHLQSGNRRMPYRQNSFMKSTNWVTILRFNYTGI